jgi:hypothetical protein
MPCLHDDPFAVIGNDKTMEVKVETVLNRGAVDLRDQSAGRRERIAVDADAIAHSYEFVRRLARVSAAPAADVDTKFARKGRQPALKSADNAGRDAGGVPVHAHDATKGLKPKRMRQPPQKLFAAVFDDDRLGNDRTKLRHPVAEPSGNATTMKWKIGTACSLNHTALYTSTAGHNREKFPKCSAVTMSISESRA